MKKIIIVISFLLLNNGWGSIATLKCRPITPCHESYDLCIFDLTLEYINSQTAAVDITRIENGVLETVHYGQGELTIEAGRIEVAMDEMDTWINLSENHQGGFTGTMIYEEDFLFENLLCHDHVEPMPYQ